jgi:Na+-transporting methylmalonyl-CoA/oxaloacetate decarboxylase gamma subunit
LMTFATYFSSFSKKGLAALAILVVVMYGFSQFIEERSSGAFDPSYNSTYVRLILPLDAISQLLAEYPFGAPFGSNSLVVQNTIAGSVANFDEGKITNGIYEIWLYTGIPGVLIVLYILFLAVRNIIRGRRKRALSQLFLLFGTVASSSLLSVESSLLTALIILAARNDVDNRAQLPAARSPQQLSPARSFAALQDR